MPSLLSKQRTSVRSAYTDSKAERIDAMLDELFPNPPPPLNCTDDFTLLVAVALSAQTTDKKVNQVTPALFARAATPELMAQLPVSTIQEFIKTVGLAPSKARRLQAMSAQLVADHGGKVPADLEALEALPGVGHKTASVILAQRFGIPAFPVDTHIHRLAFRWGLSNGKNVKQTEEDLKRLFPREHWIRLHLQFIYFGRSHCPARGHVIDDCPICNWAMPPAIRKASA